MDVSAQYATRAREVEIYALMDDLDAPRYVGKANDSKKRLGTHIRDSRRRDTPLYRWVRKCLARGFTPIVKILETCPEDQWKEREIHWISEFRGKFKLLNVADGGDEPHCPLDVRRNNGRKVAILRVNTPEKRLFFEQKRMLCAALSKGEISPETRAKLKAAALRDPAKFGAFLKWL